MKILILGGDGMLGHQLLKSLTGRHEVCVTVRQELGAYQAYGLFNPKNTYDGVDVHSTHKLLGAVGGFKPNVIINAVGIVKQRPTAIESVPSLEVNSLLPHHLAVMAKAVNARLFHFSTDCVFSGRKGHYVEGDVADADDLYGRSKYLGEVSESHCFTLRTSIIGRELSRKTSLVEWYLSQLGEVNGYRNAVYSGFTTIEMANIVDMLITQYPDAHGVWHVSSDPINKYQLLLLLKKYFGVHSTIVPYDDYHCDRSLDSSRFRSAFRYCPPTWESMIKDLSMAS